LSVNQAVWVKPQKTVQGKEEISFADLPPMTVLGDLRANGIRFSRYLREERDMDLQLLLRQGHDEMWGESLARPLDFDLPWVHLYRWCAGNPLVAVKCLRRLSKLAASHPFLWGRSGGALLGPFLGYPYVMQTVGSDVADLQFHPWWLRRLVLLALRRARVVLASQIRHLPILKDLGLDHVFLPLPVWEALPENGASACRPKGFDLVFFTCTQFYWHGIREIPKGNDRFLRAFARFIESGANACLVAVEHGLDIDEARELIEGLGIVDRVLFRKKATQREISQHYYACDVVVDSFVCGEPGLASLDAMAYGLPVMVYVEADGARLAYQEDVPPVVNVSTEQEILEGLFRLSSPEYRQELGRKATAWWCRHHHPDVVAQELLFALSGIAR